MVSKPLGYVPNSDYHVLSALHHRDAWAKHKDLDSYEAKVLYVEKLLSVCSIEFSLHDAAITSYFHTVTNLTFPTSDAVFDRSYAATVIKRSRWIL